MKTQILTIIILFAAVYCNAQDCFWAKKAGGWGSDNCNGIAINKSGNIYISGYFTSSTLDLGGITLQNHSGTDNSYYDLFIAKYDAVGNFLWAKQFSSLKNDVSNSIAVDSLSNLYITGYFTGDTLIFGNEILHNNNAPYPDFLIAKLDSNGNAIWARNAGGHSYGMGNGIAVDNMNNSYVTGGFQSDSIIFGNIVLHKMPTQGQGGGRYFYR